MYKMNAMCLKYFEIFIPKFGNRLTIWCWFGVILIFLFLFFCCYFLLYYFFLIIFNFFFLFIPFFSLQELLCALRVKSRLRHGGWLVGWFVFSDPFKRLPIFCQPFVGRNVKDFPGILSTYFTKSTLLLLET